MDIFQFALEKEKFSENFYHQLSQQTNNKGLQNICTMLADEEARHYQIIQEMQSQSLKEVVETPILKNAQDIFTAMRQSAEMFDLEISGLELFEKARDIEKQSEKFYLEKSQEANDTYQKTIFKQLANQEQKHYILIDKICDFVARPMWFLENAEMYRFDDYAEGTL